MTPGLQAVLWDFGGVFTTSPFEAFARFEKERGLPENIIRRVNSTNPDSNAWALFERAEIDPAGFDAMFARESTALGAEVRGADVLPLLAGDLRPRVVAAFHVCKDAGLKTGCITNNVNAGEGPGMMRTGEAAEQIKAVMRGFDHIIESSKAGVRKPDPRIYAMMCETLSVDPARCVYLDDLGINLKPAKAMGMTTIKVESEAQLLKDLSAATGLSFG